MVEHDEEIMRAADFLLDIGPKAGVNGGEIVFEGNLKDSYEGAIDRSLTLQYLNGIRQRYVRQKRKWSYSVRLEGVMQNNLKNIDDGSMQDTAHHPPAKTFHSR